MATTLIAKKLKQLRKENGMTQVDLAMKSGVQPKLSLHLDKHRNSQKLTIVGL